MAHLSEPEEQSVFITAERRTPEDPRPSDVSQRCTKTNTGRSTTEESHPGGEISHS